MKQINQRWIYRTAQTDILRRHERRTKLLTGRRGACQGLGEGQGHKIMKFRIEPSTASKDGHFDDRYDWHGSLCPVLVAVSCDMWSWTLALFGRSEFRTHVIDCRVLQWSNTKQRGLKKCNKSPKVVLMECTLSACVLFLANCMRKKSFV